MILHYIGGIAACSQAFSASRVCKLYLNKPAGAIVLCSFRLIGNANLCEWNFIFSNLNSNFPAHLIISSIWSQYFFYFWLPNVHFKTVGVVFGGGGSILHRKTHNTQKVCIIADSEHMSLKSLSKWAFVRFNWAKSNRLNGFTNAICAHPFQLSHRITQEWVVLFYFAITRLASAWLCMFRKWFYEFNDEILYAYFTLNWVAQISQTIFFFSPILLTECMLTKSMERRSKGLPSLSNFSFSFHIRN